ncbi:MAG: serine/threonine-protein kinase [Gemmatimonadota bacterium]
MSTEGFGALQDLLAGEYVLERELGRGGMGVVYLARESRLDRLVAVKVLPRHLGANPDLRERFIREAKTAAQLSHPNIVNIFRADEVGGYAFFTMAFIEGESLADRIRARGPLSPAEAVRVLREAAWALAYAHARGVVHRDVKPENIMLERGTNRVVVTDFGIAHDESASSITEDGMVLGSVYYMSPEQAAGDDLDGRSDLYTLGVVGFQILTGRLPFEADRAVSVMAQQVTRQAPPLASFSPNIPTSLASVIDRCLLKDPSDRYPSGEALAEALQMALEAAGPALALGSGSAWGAEVVGTEEARAIWLRAAQLQAEAATRLQERYREPTLEESGATPAPTGGFRLKDVEIAAIEAGIAPEYVALAMAQRPTGEAIGTRELSSAQEHRLTRMLGTRDRSISVSRVIRARPKAVLEAIGRVFTVHPFSLKLRDTVGGHPLEGGILVFDVPLIRFRSDQMVGNRGRAYTLFSYRLTQIDLDRLNVVIKPLGPPAEACEVTAYGDLRRGLSKNWRIDKWITGVASLGGAGAGAAVGLSALASTAVAALAATGGAVVFGAAALGWYRWLYRSTLGKSRAELEKLLAAIDADLRAASVFGIAPSGDPTTGVRARHEGL